MDIPVWKIIVFISFVFLLEYAIYGADYYAEVFAEPPAADLAPSYIIARSEVTVKDSMYVKIYPSENIDITQYHGKTLQANQVEAILAQENIWSGFLSVSHPVYILTPAEIAKLQNVDKLPAYGIKKPGVFSGAAEWLSSATAQITQFMALVWKLLSFDIPNLPPLFRTIICFPIWTGLILSFFQLIRGA